MSYRDLRNFSEAMRVLGFPRQISLESFRTPNLELVEECLRWLAARVEPDAVLDGGRASLDQRVAMVTHAIALFHSRANVKLSGRRVYGADGWAARELLRVAALLLAARAAPPPAAGARDPRPLTYDVTPRVDEIKQARSLATEITAQGAFLYDLLAKEPENKEERETALSRPLSLSELEAAVAAAAAAAREALAAARARTAAARAAGSALDGKLERRRAELQRAEKRLHTVQKIKPAYQGELSTLESEIEQLWEDYVLRFRCVEALKHQLSVLETAQAEAAEEQQAAIMQLIHKYEAEDVLGKLSDSDETDTSEEEQLREVNPRPATRPKTRLRIKTAGGGGGGGGVAGETEVRRAFGSMRGAGAAGGSGDAGDGRGSSLEDSHSEDELSDEIYDAAAGGGSGAGGAARWSRARGASRAGRDQLAHLIDGVETGGGSGSSLDSSSESELRLGSAARRPPARPLHSALPAQRAQSLSDNEF